MTFAGGGASGSIQLVGCAVLMVVHVFFVGEWSGVRRVPGEGCPSGRGLCGVVIWCGDDSGHSLIANVAFNLVVDVGVTAGVQGRKLWRSLSRIRCRTARGFAFRRLIVIGRVMKGGILTT